MKRFLALTLLLSLVLALAGCPAPTPDGGTAAGYTMTPTDDMISSLYCEETGVTYYRAAFGEFLPGSMSATPYGTATLASGTLSFYKIKDADPNEYLVQADPTDHYPMYLLYASTLTPPTLLDMAVSDILICDASADYFWRDANVIDTIRSYERVHDLVHAYEEGERVTIPPEGEIALSVELIFVSAAYKFNAVVNLTQYDDGRILLSTWRGVVEVSPNLFHGYKLQWES